MKTKLFLMCVMAASAAYSGAAMPTEVEVEKAVPKVERMLASEKAALASGKMTRAEVAEAAMKLAADADDEAAKLLLMKGAFILHVKDGDLEKAVKTMNALKTAIADMPPQVVTNIIETALLGLPNKAASGARLYRLLDEGKRKESNPDNTSASPQVVKAAMKASEGQEIVDGYTWSYAIRNGGASIEAPRGKYGCAVSPNPDGSVVIPAKLGGVNVTRIGRQAFARCHSLTSVTIPPTVTSIGMSAFYECRFDSVAIPPSVKEIESLAFYNNRCLKSVEVPEGVTSIGDEAFGFCADLESVVLPSTLVNIGRGVFACGSRRLRSIFVSPKNPKYAMYNDLLCTKDGRRVLASVGGDVVIPEGVVNIDDKAFLQCSGLTSVCISASVERISDSAFEWCEGIESFSVSPDNGMYSSPNGLLCSKDGKTLISGVNGYVRIPDGVSDIEKWAFAGRRWLTTVTIPSSVKRIGDETFRCCRALESVTMDGEKPRAKRGLFDYCENLKVIHVPADAKSWAGMKEWMGVPLVFDGCLQGQEALAREVEQKGTDAGGSLRGRQVQRQHRAGLRQETVGGYTWSFRVNNGEAEIVAEKDGKNSCAVSPAPTGSISIPSTLGGAKVTRIGERAFAGCSKDLTSVSIPAGVTHIGAMAFSGCSGLTSVAIPASVRSIGKHPFCWSPRISKITVDGANHFYRAENDALYNKAKTNLIYWPRGKKAVVEIPSSVTNIESWAFLQCDGFSSVTIPSGVMRIGEFAFCACTELMSVTVCGERPTAPDKVFRDCSKLKSIHVPANAKSWAGMTEWQGIPLVFDGQ